MFEDLQMNNRVKETTAWHPLSSRATDTHVPPDDTLLSSCSSCGHLLRIDPVVTEPRDTHVKGAGESLQLTSLQSTSAAEPLPRARHCLLLEIPFANG